MKRVILGIVLVISLFCMVACSEYNIYEFAEDAKIYVAQVGNHRFMSLQAAIDYVVSLFSGKGYVADDQDIILLKDCGGCGLVVPAGFNGSILIDFKGYTYVFDDDVEVGFDFQGGKDIELKDGTCVIKSSNKRMEDVYNVATNLEHNGLKVIDERQNETTIMNIEKGGSVNLTGEGRIWDIDIGIEVHIEKGAKLNVDTGKYKFIIIDANVAKDETKDPQKGDFIINGNCEIGTYEGLSDKIHDSINDDIEKKDVKQVRVQVIPEAGKSAHVHVYSEGHEDATCYSMGFDWKRCECGDTEVIFAGEKLPHTASAMFEADHEHHWHVCEVCGARCDADGCEYPADGGEEHTVVGSSGFQRCQECGYLLIDLGSDTKITYIDHTLVGNISSSFDANTRLWTIKFNNQNADSVPSTIVWKLMDNDGNVLFNTATAAMEETFGMNYPEQYDDLFETLYSDLYAKLDAEAIDYDALRSAMYDLEFDAETLYSNGFEYIDGCVENKLIDSEDVDAIKAAYMEKVDYMRLMYLVGQESNMKHAYDISRNIGRWLGFDADTTPFMSLTAIRYFIGNWNEATNSLKNKRALEFKTVLSNNMVYTVQCAISNEFGVNSMTYSFWGRN